MLAPDEPVEQEVETLVARFTPEIAGRIRACRAALRARIPTANELVYDNCNALALGYAPRETSSEAILSIAAYPRIVRLFFLQGAGLPDPDKILEGAGSRVRSIVLAGPDTFDAPPVAAMIAAALEHARIPLPETGIGRTIVKSISPNQRPRRPAAKDSA
ncbi:hypothetical protein OF829_17855 [Sphingomonas sp. LB-2]|uniref:hypothetical protein n=1 Tax=Sphingomonas caeni TaxID=2984949 RepID=UPI00222F71A8|nr:hypothetical protein [Sphingomonas caeni]MCW3849108.1 hypothetical protein [Sphingomonas caeni]